jgi:hypothetical protein
MHQSARVHHQSLTPAPIGRRIFFRQIASGLSGYALLPALAASARAQDGGAPQAKAKSIIFVLLSGGISQTDTFDLKEGGWTPSNFAPVDFGPIRWPQQLLPLLGDQLPSIALLRSVQAWAEEHSLAREWLQIGRNPTRPDSAFSPHIGSVIASELAPENPEAPLPAYVSLNVQAGANPDAGFLPARDAPFLVSDVPGIGLSRTQHPDGRARFDLRANLLEQVESGAVSQGGAFEETAAHHANALKLINDPRVNQALIFSEEERARYGNSTFGNSCLAARNLLRSKLGPRFIQISFGDWDHHGQIYSPKAMSIDPGSMARQLDSGLGSMIADLKKDGLLDETLIVAISEFGRTVGSLSSAAGRDHFLIQTALVAGGSITGGRPIGKTDSTGRSILESGWRFDRPMRPEDIEATLYWALGIDWRKSVANPRTGNKFRYVPGSDTGDYAPITELWG